MRFAYNSKKPTYIRIGKKGEGEVEKLSPVQENSEYFGPFYSSKSPDSKAVVISCGTISENVFSACDSVRLGGSSIDYILQPQISPVNYDALGVIASKYELIVTVEEHNEIGALSAIYSSYLGKRKSGPILQSISTPATFHVGLGSLEEARTHLNLDAKSIARRITSILSK
jgi:transketolase